MRQYAAEIWGVEPLAVAGDGKTKAEKA